MKQFAQKYLTTILWVLLGLTFIGELIRDTAYEGDFMGYVIAGKLVLQGEPIYSSYLNTWPPFFSVFSIPLTYAHHVSSLATNLIWQIGSLGAFFASLNILLRWSIGKRITWKTTEEGISLFDWKVLAPTLLCLRFILDNLSNIQINIYLLWLSLLVIDWFFRKRWWSASALLAFIISLKVYPIFILLFLVFKRKWRMASLTGLFLIAINALCIPFYGWEGTVANFATWLHEVMPNSFIANHKNQSLLGFLLRLFTDLDVEFVYKINFLNLDPEQVKKISYAIIGLLALPLMYLFRAPIKAGRPATSDRLQFVFLLAAIPIISPLAWKAYFIFISPAIFWLYHLLYTSKSLKVGLRWVFGFAMVLIIGSTDLFLGSYRSDVVQMYGVLLWGVATLLSLLVVYFIKSGYQKN